ncbi:penicillin-binding protein [bacterium]|jgi:membrane peptidoglycan carboxypeptidase|nr:penicillin-binding protein [bacterium]MBT4251307.1 penicillin-binding protein [bacterium]MBT4598312.1 penicillin-binding protein [bacterium]MBT6754145.1 penicillin-binding protein [bacterium]MBT7037965.1 penicillin-binding protein [bacterium]
MWLVKLILLAVGTWILAKLFLSDKDLGNLIKKKNRKLSPTKGSNKKRKPRSFLVKSLWTMFYIGISLVAIVVCILGYAFVKYAKDLPDPEKVNSRVVAESTKIFDRTGDVLLYEVFGEEKRTIIPLEEIPDSVKYATIVLEDDIFYSHNGFDMGGLVKAICHEASSRAGMGDLGGICPRRGGSTITQQFIKNSILTSERSYERKLKELILAVEIEQKFSKDEILRMYLNEIPYGSNAYGIEAAAQTFFGVHAKELTLAQSALLAGLPNASTFYSPHGSNTDRLLVRWKKALNLMSDLGYITKEQAVSAIAEDILGQIKPIKADIKAPHFALYVREKLIEEFGEEKLKEKGLKIYTTLDWDLQQLGEKVVKEGVEKNGERYGFTNSALVATNPKNGQVLAMVGSKDYFDEEIDGNVNVTTRLRQPGSSVKPYVYAQAFSKGYDPETIIFDVKTKFSESDNKEEEYKPENYDGKFRGPVSMKKALSTSLNVPAVKTLYLAGIKPSINLMREMGISTLTDPGRYGLSLVLGGGEVKLIEHVGAFGVFANEGRKHEQSVILRVEDAEGNILQEFKEKEGRQVLGKKVAATMSAILSDNNLRASAFGTQNPLYIEGRSVIAKTGTTNEFRDGWLVGASRSLAAGVWSGNNDNTAMKPGAAGANISGPTWHAFMVEALKNSQDEEFLKIEDIEDEENDDEEVKRKGILYGKIDFVEKIEVCKYDDGDYCLENSSCPEKKVDKKKYFTGHNILYYVNKDDPQGGPPKRAKDDPQYKNWEKAVLEWAEDHADGKGRKLPPEKKCKDSYFD